MGNRRLPIPERPWHKKGNGCWSLSLGVRGLRVRVEQREPRGTFHRAYWKPGKGWRYQSLGTNSKTESRRLSELFLRELERSEGRYTQVTEPLVLEQLWTRYQQEAPGYRQNTERTKAQKRSDAKLLMAGLAAQKRVDHFTRNDIDRYVEMRRTGHGWPDGRVTQPVRARGIEGELKLLITMILWATRERRPDGSWLLAENPLRGLKLPKEDNPLRPVATYDRFVKVRDTVKQLAEAAPQERGRTRWRRIELALVLAEATGARLGAIRGLRWSDITSDPPSIRWRAEFDKKGRERFVPLPEELASELRGFQVRLGVVGDGWLFPRAEQDVPWPRELFDQLLRHAERVAGVTKLKGGLWHPYRRKWATERKKMSLVDVKAAGGWRDTQTLLASYQQADEDTMLEVMASPVKLRERKAIQQGHSGTMASTRPGRPAGGRAGRSPVEVPVEVPVAVPVEVSAEVPVDVPTGVPADVPEELPEELSGNHRRNLWGKHWRKSQGKRPRKFVNSRLRAF